MKVLIVDDDEALRSAVSIMLHVAGYETCEASDGISALKIFDNASPDLVIMDVMLPRLDGFEACAVIRRICPTVPILFLSAKSDISDKAIGYQAGGDDYLTKPFSQKELLLRIGALLRRAQRVDLSESAKTVTTGELCIDFGRREVLLSDKRVSLSPKEFGIMVAMGKSLGRVFTRDELIEEVWGPEYCGTAISIPTYIRHIRLKIEEDPSQPKYLQTVGRLGYRLGD